MDLNVNLHYLGIVFHLWYTYVHLLQHNMSESVIQDMRCILRSAVYQKNISLWIIDKDHC